MAARKITKAAPVESAPTVADVFAALIEFGSTEENTTSIKDLEMELAETIPALLPVLDSLEDAKLIDSSGRGADTQIWLIVDATEANAAEILAEAFDKTEETKVKPAAVKSATGLTRAQVAKDAATVTVTPLPVSEPVKAEEPTAVVYDFTKAYAAIKTQRDNADQDRANWTELDDVDVPALPAGVNENAWFMAHNAQGVTERDTYSARLWWLEYCGNAHFASLAAA